MQLRLVMTNKLGSLAILVLSGYGVPVLSPKNITSTPFPLSPFGALLNWQLALCVRRLPSLLPLRFDGRPSHAKRLSHAGGPQRSPPCSRCVPASPARN